MCILADESSKDETEFDLSINNNPEPRKNMKTQHLLLTLVASLLLCLSLIFIISNDGKEEIIYEYDNVSSDYEVEYDYHYDSYTYDTVSLQVSQNIYEMVSVANPQDIYLTNWHEMKPKPLDQCEGVDEFSYATTYKYFCENSLPGDGSFLMSYYVSKRMAFSNMLKKGTITKSEHDEMLSKLERACHHLVSMAMLESLLHNTYIGIGETPPEKPVVTLEFAMGGDNFHGRDFSYGLSPENTF